MNNKRIINRRAIVWVIVVVALLCMPVFAVNGEPLEQEQQKVLLISSYSPNYMTFFNQIDGIKDQFEGRDIQLDIEFMDTKRFFTEENIENFHKTLSYKIKHSEPYDALIVADDNALNYYEVHAEELFKGIPLVFLGINNVEHAEIAANNPLITGVVESISLLETIEIAYDLIPEAKRVVAIVDATTTGQGDLVTFYESASEFPNLDFETIDLSYIDYTQFEDELSLLNEQDIVILLSLYADQNETRINFDQGMKLIQDNAKVPVFHIYYHGVGDGLLGGKIVSHYEQGKQAAQMVLKIFSNTSPSEIPLLYDSPNITVIDYAVLEAYNLDPKKLPIDTEFINKDENIALKYWGYLLAFLFVIALESLFIIKLKRTLQKNLIIEDELRLSHKDLQTTVGQLMQSNNDLIEKEDKIHELIYIDTLTGLKNRNWIKERLKDCIEKCSNPDALKVIFMDIDNFKDINDSYGHDTGDNVIRKHAEKLREFGSDKVQISRFGGDEFLILYRSEEDIIEFITRLQHVFSEPLLIKDQRFYLTFSIGITDYQQGIDTAGDLIKKADLALNHAKSSGKNTYKFFNDALLTNFENKISFQSNIKKALKEEEFFLEYQPQIDAYSGKLVGVEALIRWKDAQGMSIPAEKLINNAEEMGIISEIGEWVMKEACRFLHELKSNQITLKMSINISSLQLRDQDFYDQVMEIIESTGVDPTAITFEVTETSILESLETSKVMLRKLQRKGFLIALDDFGTGYSSLKYFNELPIDILKIDKSFIDAIETNDYSRDLIEAVIIMAHNRGIEVVAEGVEERSQLNLLKKMGCDIIQGYYYYKSLTGNEVLALLDH
jgi:diguanylate cyclase (GGDEF)-like protein